ncbi:hypothetical protein Clacol_000249 [Clathrus columnatus]|uniref:RRM domain-containing protein n=1 Tax=Clathrus columnatus TaxID=1419009 RepID=A0AAV4ZWB8_9AGAM|nr:hypothetical protein Clacol_000249 [Clathrus columnatus]
MSTTNTPPAVIQGRTFEEQAAAFGDDERVHFSKESGTWRYEAEDGMEMEWDVSKSAWVPVIDDDLVKAQQAAYSLPGVDESVPAAPVMKRESKKRKAPEDYTSNTTPSGSGVNIKRAKGSKAANNGATTETRQSKNTAVYITGLPPDTTKDELAARFSKCGLIMENDDGDPKVKLYAKEDGSFNGEALVVYFKEDSVSLALSILDDAELRLGEAHTRMKVQVAQFGHKRQEGKEMDHARIVDKKKATKRIGKLQKKLEEWDDSDQFGPSVDHDTDAPTLSKNRVVILKHMFTLEELEKDATLLLDLKEDVREECETLGDVTNVVLYDKEPEGIMTVKFRDPVSAQACVIKLNGRFFAGRRIQASIYTGSQRFKRSGMEETGEDDSEEAEKARLDNFAEWLMKEGE